MRSHRHPRPQSGLCGFRNLHILPTTKAYISCFLFYCGLLAYSPTLISVNSLVITKGEKVKCPLLYPLICWFHQTHTSFLRHTSASTTPLFSALPLTLGNSFFYAIKELSPYFVFVGTSVPPLISLYSSWHVTKQLSAKGEGNEYLFSLKLLYHYFKAFLRAHCVHHLPYGLTRHPMPLEPVANQV